MCHQFSFPYANFKIILPILLVFSISKADRENEIIQNYSGRGFQLVKTGDGRWINEIDGKVTTPLLRTELERIRRDVDYRRRENSLIRNQNLIPRNQSGKNRGEEISSPWSNQNNFRRNNNKRGRGRGSLRPPRPPQGSPRPPLGPPRRRPPPPQRQKFRPNFNGGPADYDYRPFERRQRYLRNQRPRLQSQASPPSSQQPPPPSLRPPREDKTYENTLKQRYKNHQRLQKDLERAKRQREPQQQYRQPPQNYNYGQNGPANPSDYDYGQNGPTNGPSLDYDYKTGPANGPPNGPPSDYDYKTGPANGPSADYDYKNGPPKDFDYDYGPLSDDEEENFLAGEYPDFSSGDLSDRKRPQNDLRLYGGKEGPKKNQLYKRNNFRGSGNKEPYKRNNFRDSGNKDPYKRNNFRDSERDPYYNYQAPRRPEKEASWEPKSYPQLEPAFPTYEIPKTPQYPEIRLPAVDFDRKNSVFPNRGIGGGKSTEGKFSDEKRFSYGEEEKNFRRPIKNFDYQEENVNKNEIETDRSAFRRGLRQQQGGIPMHAVPRSLTGHVPDMRKQKIVTESPTSELKWVDSKFIHNQHSRFTNQVLTEFQPLKNWGEYRQFLSSLVHQNVDADVPIKKLLSSNRRLYQDFMSSNESRKNQIVQIFKEVKNRRRKRKLRRKFQSSRKNLRN